VCDAAALVIGDAGGERYLGALEAVIDDPGVDGVLVMHVPAAVVSSEGAAEHVIEVVNNTNCPVLTSWLGRDAVEPSRDILRNAGVPTYDTPYDAICAFLHMVNDRRNQENLMQVPPSVMLDFAPDTEKVRRIVDRSVASAVDVLSEVDAKAILQAYGVKVVETRIARSPDDAVDLAEELGYPVAIKILSPQITHKSDVGGVALDLEDPDAVRAAVLAMQSRAATLRPNAEVQGFTVQRMANRKGVHELIVGMTTDAIFGPVILFGHGGTAVEVIGDRAIGLPPLNMSLARDLISQTRVSKLLRGYRDRAAADIDAIGMVLLQVAQLVTDIPEIAELDINPLFADEAGAIAVDARIRVAHSEQRGPERLAITPYPKELEEHTQLTDGTQVVLRPIRPEDLPAHERFVTKLTRADLRQRFLGVVRDLPRSQMARLTQIDYDREMAFIATEADGGDEPETFGVVRIVTDPGSETAEFAIIIRSDLKGQGIGTVLMEKMIRYCRQRGIGALATPVLLDNMAMRALMKKLGFVVEACGDDKTVIARKRLSE